MLHLRTPYLLFLGQVQLKSDAKTAFGLRDWCREKVLGEWSLQGASVSLDLPRLSPQEAAKQGAGSLVIGVAPVGGRLPAEWIATLREALLAGLDVVSGMHTKLESFDELVNAAKQSGARLINVRHSEHIFNAASGIKRQGKRVLTVGSDCALGKKYTALALTNALHDTGHAATFRATGQTGIMIAGHGVAIDAVIADFIAGAAEQLSPNNDAHHWDVIEGQGAIIHPAYAGVTLGLLHGSQPDALVLCHDPSRKTIEDYPHIEIPDLRELIALYIALGRLTNANIQCVGISINTSNLAEAERDRYCRQLEQELQLPVADPIRHGMQTIAAELIKRC